MRYVALLRGINVNGRRTVRMEELRALVADLGYADVRTYIQSGNVLLSGDDGAAGAIGRAIERGIAERFGIPDVAVVVLTSGELGEMVAGNPFVREGLEPKTLYAAVLARAPEAGRVEAIPAEAYLPDRFAVAGRCVYVHCPNGFHATKLNNGFFEARLGVAATSRNWNTMVKLAGMAGA